LAHQTYIQTSENKGVVQSLQAQIDIEGIIMYHVELDPDDAPLPLDAPIISVNKHFIKAGQRQAFEREFGQVQHLLQNYTKPRPTAGGWRIEKESDGKEEWILFSGFESVDDHHGFAKSAQFGEYKRILKYVDGFEVKHLRCLEGP
jgi:heme-degrading monooxygenase HmoA